MVISDLILWFAETIWLFLPAYFANAAPVLLHGGGPLDGGRVLSDGRRLLGDHKTIYGTLAGVVVGSAVGLAQMSPFRGFLFASGAILGDLVFAFFKRRLDIRPGQPLPLWDQVGFILFAIALGSLVQPAPTWEQDAAMIVTTIPVHYVSNLFAWGLKMKKEPW